MSFIKRICAVMLSASVFFGCMSVIGADRSITDNDEYDIWISGQLPAYDGRMISLIVLKNGKSYEDYLNNSDSIENAAVIQPDINGNYEYRANMLSQQEYYRCIINAGGKNYEKLIKNGKKQNLNAEIHVSPVGNDENGASVKDPLKTPEAARDKVGEYSETKMPVDIVFHGGEYVLNTAFTLTEADSGTESAPITYRAADGEKPVFIGTKQIDISGFEQIKDTNIINRLPEISREKVLQINLVNNNIKKYDLEDMIYWLRGSTPQAEGRPMNETGIYLNGEKQRLSRWPNSGYAEIGETNPGGQYVAAGGIPYDGEGGNTDRASFSYAEDNPSRWTQAKDLCITGYLSTDWAGEWAKVRSIDTEAKKITLNSWTAYGVKKGYRWAAVNLLEEIDIPGEWYIDIDSMVMYYYPPRSLNAKEDTLEITVMKNDLFKVTNAENIIFENLGFERVGASNTIGREASVGNGIEIIGGKNIKISGCNFENIGRNGIKFDGTDIQISGCTFYNIGYNGILMLGGGDRAALISGRNVICNNMISNVNLINATGEGGILILGGVGTIVEHNVIHNSASFAINYAGNENIIRYNEIYRTNTNQNDAGAIYAGRNWSQYGTIIEYNYIHDLQDIKYNDEAFVTSAIYWDDSHSGNTARNNIVVYNSKANSTFLRHHGGRDNLIENNIIVNSLNTISATCGWYYYSLENLKEIVQYKSLREVPYNSEPFLSRYPAMSQIYSDIERDGRMISSLKAVGNVSVDVETNDIHPTVRLDDTDNRYDLKDYSIFVDPIRQDYRIKRESKERLGLPDGILDESFDISLIGIQDAPDCIRDAFSVQYPQNASAVEKAERTEFVWEAAKYADEYTVTIAKDEEFTDIVREINVRDTTAVTEGLPYGKYFWKVTATDISRSTRGSWETETSTFTVIPKRIKVDNISLTLDGEPSESISGSVRDAVLTAKITSYEEQNAVCIAAQRRSDGSLAAAQIKHITLVNGENSFSMEFNTCGEEAVLELFIWDILQRPLCKKIIITNE